MHAISIGSIAVDVHDHLAPEEVNLVVNDLLKEDLELSMDLIHLAGRTDVIDVKDSNSNSVQPSTLDRCPTWICGGF